MSLQPFKDYVFVEKVFKLMDDGVFVGTTDYFFCIPSKITDHEFHQVTTTKFSFKGKKIHEAVQDIIDQSETVGNLESTLLDLQSEFPEMECHQLNEVTSFKIQAGFLGSGIHVQQAGKRGWSPFVQKLGKDKKAIRAFYESHPKLK